MPTIRGCKLLGLLAIGNSVPLVFYLNYLKANWVDLLMVTAVLLMFANANLYFHPIAV